MRQVPRWILLVLKLFPTYDEAKAFGTRWAEENLVRVYLCRTQSGQTWLAGPSSAHLLPVWSAEYNMYSWTDLYKIATPTEMALCELQERPALPGSQERWYQRCITNTVGYSHEQLIQLAENIERYDTCIWHECARLDGTLDDCKCGVCSDSRRVSKLLDTLTDAEKTELLYRVGG